MITSDSRFEPMIREVLTINVGECGVELGHRVWRQYCKEHNIDENGNKLNKHTSDDDDSFRCFFQETQSGQYIPRNIMVDLDQDTIDNIKHSQHFKIFHPEFLVSGKEDAANCWSRGHHTVGTDVINTINDSIRKLMDKCDDVQGFIMNHSVGGGTGSGLGSLILERIAADYRKKTKVGCCVYPSNNDKQNISHSVVEPYNALLATHYLLDYAEVSFVYDNRKIYDLCQNHLVEQPIYNDLNSLICKHESSVTCSLRNKGNEGFTSLNDIVTKHCPFPRLQFVIPSMAPIINDVDIKKVYIGEACGNLLIDGFVRWYYSYPNNIHFDLLQYEPPLYKDIMVLLYQSYKDKSKHYGQNYYELDEVYDLYQMCCNSDYFMVEIDDFDPEERICCNDAITTNCHGNFEWKDVNRSAQKLKTNKRVTFVGWAPTGFKLGIHDNVIPIIDGDTIIPHNTVIMNFTNFAISRICKNFDSMYHSQKAFVHWFVAEGMESAEFEEAREDLGFLVQDYLDCICEAATDEEEESEDYNFSLSL